MRLQGSLVNRMMEVSKQPMPTVGMAATITCYSDRHAGTVVEVLLGGKEICVQQDKATRIDSLGMTDAQSYSYERDPNGRHHRFTLRKSGQYVPLGQSAKNASYGLLLGHRDEHYDYSF